MGCFITGGTGFIGRHLVAQLLARGETIWVLVRPESRARFERRLRDWGASADQVVPITGDLTAPLLGVPAAQRDQLRGRIRHCFHLGALYDLAASAAELDSANVAGTRHALEFAHDTQAGCFHLVSSVAAAGRYPGSFSEDMFQEAGVLDHPYFRTKHESEALVRQTCQVPWRVYRPGIVVGHSGTGVTDKIDGPYFLFKAIQRLRDYLPRWVPLIGFEGGHINLVPVDFVAAALAHLALLPGHDGQCFHLTDPIDRRFGAVLNVFARAAHAPTMALRVEHNLWDALVQLQPAAPALLPPAARIIGQLLDELGIPRSLAGMFTLPTTFDSRQAQALLASANIQVPALEDYAWRLWDYWERCLDSRAAGGGAAGGGHLAATVRNRNVLITGGSSGIGRATALQLAAAGAHVIIVARDEGKLAAVRAAIQSAGGRVSSYRCDIADPAACDQFIAQLLAEHGHVDILINNAGRSIRRAIDNTYNRAHDYERLMRINYFAAVRVTLGLLPMMVQRGAGHVVNISSIGVLTNAPRFGGYNASKAALETFSRCAAAEYAARGIHFTVINLPLVRTAMVAPTRVYEHFPLLRPEQAAERICAALIHRPERVATPLGTLAQLLELFAPKLSRAIMSEAYTMFPESAAAGGAADAEAQLSAPVRALVSLAHAVHE
jgi:NAD(P)-dependent dehydrogenase (short-subunit alcohol dehydrogenase family)